MSTARVCPVDLTSRDTYLGGIPHEVFTQLRRERPIHWHETERGGYWALTKHADIRAVSRDTDTYSSAAQGVFYEAQGALEGSLLTADPPEHTRLRKAIDGQFTAHAVTILEPWLRATAQEIMAEAATKTECDFVYDLAARLPLLTICELMAVPPEDRPRLLDLGDQIIRAPDVAAIQQAMIALGGYGLELARERRGGDGDDLVSIMTRSTFEDRPLTDGELAGQFMQVAIAANETTRTLLSCVALELAARPALFAELKADPGLLPLAVEEFLRWVSPIYYMRRTATRRSEIRGQTIEAGDAVVMYYASANRDEDVFAEPDRLDIRRQPNPHLAFGVGRHSCLGSALARLEARVFLQTFFETFSRIELAGDPVRLPSNVTNSWDHIPVRLSR
jgi:cytochrome P450